MAVFTLEAVSARHGDALILHYGPWATPERILIDGGPRGVYKSALEPRFAQLRQDFQIADDAPLSFELVMISHIDDDHIAGIIDVLEALDAARSTNRPPPYSFPRLWHNSFDDILGSEGDEIVSRMAATAASTSDIAGLPLPAMSREARAVVASTAQGRHVRDLARKLEIAVNDPFEGLLVAPAEKPVGFSHGLSLTLLGPCRDRVHEYQKQWFKDLKKILKNQSNAARASAFSDSSAFNLASVCVMAEMGGMRMLLTGDARGDYLLQDLEAQGLLRQGRTMHVDLLKVPHHGSDRNVEEVFFERITADHYVISGNGEHGNPDRSTLDMIVDARGDEEYTVHFTVTRDQHVKEPNKKRKAALRRIDDWARAAPDNCIVIFRDDDAEIFSTSVDLLEPLYEE